MILLKEIVANPSGFDSLANYLGEIPEADWLCLMTRTRDADCLTQSNFRCALRALGGESDDVEVHRFGHWACGWWEAIAVRAGSAAAELAQEIYDALERYPVVDDEDFSALETEEANRVWSSRYTEQERIEYIRDNESQFTFRSFGDIRQCVRGEYFGGHASELIDK